MCLNCFLFLNKTGLLIYIYEVTLTTAAIYPPKKIDIDENKGDWSLPLHNHWTGMVWMYCLIVLSGQTGNGGPEIASEFRIL